VNCKQLIAAVPGKPASPRPTPTRCSLCAVSGGHRPTYLGRSGRDGAVSQPRSRSSTTSFFFRRSARQRSSNAVAVSGVRSTLSGRAGIASRWAPTARQVAVGSWSKAAHVKAPPPVRSSSGLANVGECFPTPFGDCDSAGFSGSGAADSPGWPVLPDVVKRSRATSRGGGGGKPAVRLARSPRKAPARSFMPAPPLVTPSASCAATRW